MSSDENKSFTDIVNKPKDPVTKAISESNFFDLSEILESRKLQIIENINSGKSKLANEIKNQITNFINNNLGDIKFEVHNINIIELDIIVSLLGDWSYINTVKYEKIEKNMNTYYEISITLE